MEPPSLGRIESIKALYINAPVKKVWAVHADINKWAAWHAGITEASLNGRLAPGAVFRWKSGGLAIECWRTWKVTDELCCTSRPVESSTATRTKCEPRAGAGIG